MLLRHLRLHQFKNYESLDLQFDEGVHCLAGPNGSGKTNLLDAIHYLCVTRSAFSSTEAQNMLHGTRSFAVSGKFEAAEGLMEAVCGVQEKEKILRINRRPYTRSSEYIGHFTCVLLAPHDTDLVRDGSEERRRFFDSLIAQADAVYLQDLIRYGHALRQRNALLRQFALGGYTDHDLLEPYTALLLDLSARISARRAAVMEWFGPVFLDHYARLAGPSEPVGIRYQTQVLSEGFAGEVAAALPQDIALHRSTLGAHRDDYDFRIGHYPLKKYGSQGQQKSFVVALKLAKFDYLTRQKGYKPLLLLDDIFDKLDDARIGHLLDMVGSGRFGQVFLTDARPERARKLLGSVVQHAGFYHIRQGQCPGREQDLT